MPAMMPDVTDPLPTDVCALALAAGEGRRLRPLTRGRPKPLCPVGNVPLLDLAVARVRTVATDVAVNVHHGRAAIEDHLAAGAGGPLGSVHLSVEQDEALGTAGALGLLRPWVDGRGVVVVNADTWAPGDLATAAAGWDRERVRLLVAGEDRLWPPERPTSQVAAAFMPWSEVRRLEVTPSGLWEVSWRRLHAAGALEVVRWDGPCLDCGTPARYLAANMAASDGDSVVGAGAEIEGTLDGAVVWAGARLRRGEHLAQGVRTDDGVTVLVR